MAKIKSFSVGNGDMFYIKHNSDNFTVIDCNLLDDLQEQIMNEICEESKEKTISRFISTHPDEDHIYGIKYFNERKEIVNFYCVANKVTKTNEESSSFQFYCKIRDDVKKTFHIERDCKRKWMNESSEERGSSGLNILWPITSNDKFQEALKIAENGGNANNISPIIEYCANGGITVLWFGDMEHDFMDSIKEGLSLPNADVIFAPHHGRLSGAIPKKWLNEIKPKIIIIGEADSELLDYYNGYNTITQNKAKDITLLCDGKKIHFYCSSPNYAKRSFLTDEGIENDEGYYIGTLNL